MTPEKILLKAAKLIDRPEKWVKGRMKDQSRPQVRRCAYGALVDALPTRPGRYYEAKGSLLDTMAGNITMANDHLFTTWEDVFMSFLLAAEISRE